MNDRIAADGHLTITVGLDCIRALGREWRSREAFIELLRDGGVTSLDIKPVPDAPYELIGMAIYAACRCNPPIEVRVQGAP